MGSAMSRLGRGHRCRWIASPINQPQVMTGITPTTFEPDDPITRAQVARLLYNEEGAPDVSGYGPHPFTDVPAWVDDAVTWAYGEGLVTGITPTTSNPNDPSPAPRSPA